MNEQSKPPGGFLTTLKSKVVFVTVLVGGLAALLGNLNTITGFFSNLFSSKVTITGIIVNSDKSPAEKSHVTLFLYGKNKSDSLITIADEEGAFRFDNVPGKRFDDFRIDVSWKDKTASYTNKLKKSNIEKPITIPLPDLVQEESSNPLSFTYYNIKGHAIDYLLEGQIDPQWEKKLSRNPYIITNEVFKILSDLRNRFHYPNDPTMQRSAEFMPGEYFKKNKSDKQVESGKAYTLTRYLAGTHDYAEVENGVLEDFITINEAVATSLVGEKLTQKLKSETRKNFAYDWFPSRQQLETIKKAQGNNKSVNFLLEISKNYFPDSLVKASMYFDDDPCVDAWEIQLTPPCLSLKAVLIENPSSETLSLGDFYMRQSKNTDVRIHTLQAGSQDDRLAFKYFPKQKLKPGETIILPLELVLKTVQKRQFSYGPVQTVQSIEINKDNYAVRKEDTQNIFMYDGSGGIGSCPYVYTFSREENTWLLEDHILYGNSSKEKEKEHTLILNRFNGTIQVREIDPETSYIDYLYILHTFPDGRITLLKSNHGRLAEKDGHYLELKRGDKIVLDFPKEENTKGTYSVISHGYYLPHQ